MVTIKSKDNLCCARAIVTMKESADKGSHYQNLRKGKPIQERWAKLLHQEASVPEGPCGYGELQKFQDCLGPQGYQLIVVEPSKCLIVFKETTFNDAPQIIALVKHQDHYDGLTSIPALLNRSYYCRHWEKGYDFQDRHHNCRGQNCPACARRNKTCPNFATWVKPTLECPQSHVKFYGQDCFDAHKTKAKKKGAKSLCESWRKFLHCSAEYAVNPKKPHQCFHATCRNCGEFAHVHHRCYIQPVRPKEDAPQEDPLVDPVAYVNDDDNEKRGPPPPPLLNFADIECFTTEDRVFVQKLICWSTQEDD